MTNEEALELLKDHEYWADISVLDEMAEVAIKALEKQIVKKIIVHTESHRSFTVLCPSCRAVLFKRITQDGYDYPRRIYNKNNWCLTCGQHITWDEWENEE